VIVSGLSSGSPAECFVMNRNSRECERDIGILLSLFLQRGCPVEAISCAIFRNIDGGASGVVGAVLDIITG
jgi:hypothetical protein